MTHRLLLATAFIAAPHLFAAERYISQNSTPAAVERVNWTTGVSYTYDGAGNVRQIGEDRFAYDRAHRLVEARTNGITRAYRYDAFGNRTACTHEPGTALQGDCQFGLRVDSSSNRVHGVRHGESGNVETFQGHTYTYDALNMPVRDAGPGQAHEFIYTADDERIAVTGSTWNWTVRDMAGKVLREFTSGNGAAGAGSGAWSWKRDYVYRDGFLLASTHVTDGLDVTYHYHLDHLGSPRRITDQTDRTVGFHDYYAFGPEINGGLTEPSATTLQYTGHERDKTGGVEGPDTLDYMHRRYYSPMLGRFLTTDPVWDFDAAVAVPQLWNRYTYAVGNPFKFVDPTGEIINLASLSPAERQQVLDDLNAFTGNQYDVNANGDLYVVTYGQNASPTATRFLDSAIGATNVTYAVVAANGTDVLFGENNSNTNVISFDFKDFTDVKWNGIPPVAFGLGALLVHEVGHLHPQQNGQILDDGPSNLRDTQVGPLETNLVNVIRAERGLPLRGPAYEGKPAGFIHDRVLINFRVGNKTKYVNARSFH